MKKKIINIIKFTLFFLVGIILFWLVYRDQNFKDILNELKKLNYWWVSLTLVFALLSHLSRALRWNLLIQSLGHKSNILNTFLSIMVMYLANLALPRMGEFTRCAIINRYEKISLPKLLGTVILERIIDFIVLVLLFFIVIITQFHVVIKFIKNNPELSHKFDNLFSSEKILFITGTILVLLIIIFLLFKNHIKTSWIYRKIAGFIIQIFDGIKTIRNMKNAKIFIFHTIFIYAMYYLMTYVFFWSFLPTANLSLIAGLSTLVIGSFGMVAPVQGGIGAYHFMVMETLFIYGISRTNGKIFALVQHGSINLMLIVVGFICLILLPVVNKKRSI
ncbi:MAG: flippase-like domain-containing protein [Bacteroidales bacterium]|nr:flippase-like domain-containing protein [Bacteroidales bacterium]